jgi:hypothetical protein
MEEMDGRTNERGACHSSPCEAMEEEEQQQQQQQQQQSPSPLVCGHHCDAEVRSACRRSDPLLLVAAFHEEWPSQTVADRLFVSLDLAIQGEGRLEAWRATISAIENLLELGPLTPHAMHGLTSHLNMLLWDSSLRTACGEATIIPCLLKVIETLYIPLEGDAARGLYCGDEWATLSPGEACRGSVPDGAATIATALATTVLQMLGDEREDTNPETMWSSFVQTIEQASASTRRSVVQNVYLQLSTE